MCDLSVISDRVAGFEAVSKNILALPVPTRLTKA